MRMPKSRLAVIEGKWGKNTNVSVKALFDVLSDINFDTPHAYAYEMFCDAASLDNIISRMGANKSIKYLYIGAHGENDAISAPGGKIKRTKLKNSLLKLREGSMEGLFLGSCLFGSAANMRHILCPPLGANPPVKWVAGYTEKIDWVQSSVLDLLFWKLIFENPAAPTIQIERVAERLRDLEPGLVTELGFCIYVRSTASKGVRNLLVHLAKPKK